MLEYQRVVPGCRNRDRVNDECQVRNVNDGSIMEIAVAGFLLDLTDPYNPEELWDTIELPVRYVGDIIIGCQVLVDRSGWGARSWQRANGIDELIYCFENSMSAAGSGYFATRHPILRAVDQRHSVPTPPGWNAAAIRELWLQNLYPEGQ
jgi:hypothetical protein